MKDSILAIALSAAVVSAHFNLDFPTARGFDEDKLGNFPCGGQDTVSKTRTLWPMSGGQIALTMGHDDANVQVLIGMGNDPGSAFNTIIRPTFSETGLGDFCMEGLSVPGAMDGMNATIQVITNGDPDGGLYNCADITFSSTATQPSASVCKNGTGVTTAAASSSMSPNLTSSASAGSTEGNKTAGASKMQTGVSIAGLLVLVGTLVLL